jgi:hypothetical protein
MPLVRYDLAAGAVHESTQAGRIQPDLGRIDNVALLVDRGHCCYSAQQFMWTGS